MKKLLIIAFLLALIYVTSFVLRDEIIEVINRAAVILSDSEELETLALNHYNTLNPEDALEAETAIKIHREYIDTDKEKDFIAIFNSDKSCGDGGCVASVFLNKNRTYEPIPFEYAINTYDVLPSITNNMHDIRINKVKLNWNGNRYTIYNE